MRPQPQELRSGFEGNWGREHSPVRGSRAEQVAPRRTRPRGQRTGGGGREGLAPGRGRGRREGLAREAVSQVSSAAPELNGCSLWSSYRHRRPKAARTRIRGDSRATKPRPPSRPSCHPEETRPEAPSPSRPSRGRETARLQTPSRRPPAHPDALQHPDPLLLVHPERRPAALAALGAAHGGRRLRSADAYGTGAACQQNRVLLTAVRSPANPGAGRGALWGL